MKTSIQILIIIYCLSCVLACKTEGFFKAELERINNQESGEIMPLFTISVKSDSLLLRKQARSVKPDNLHSNEMQLLKKRMLATVTDSSNLGVGIAAPQVGVSLQMIYVQRFDKPGEPFEVYYNPVIVEYGDSINAGKEGCLSVPHYRGQVSRSQNIVISYMDSMGNNQTEKINDFTAVIFQHEVDHINGKLYYDHVINGFEALSYVEDF